MKTKEEVVSNYSKNVRGFWFPVLVLVLGIIGLLIGYMYAWPYAFLMAVAIAILILVKKHVPEDWKSFTGLTDTIVACALCLLVFGFIATHAKIWLS